MDRFNGLDVPESLRDAGIPLDIVFRDCGVRAYLIAGVATEVGIEPTARHCAAFAGDAIIADTAEVCAGPASHN